MDKEMINYENEWLMDEWYFFNLGRNWFINKERYYKRVWDNEKYDDDYKKFKRGYIAGQDCANDICVDSIMHWLMPYEGDESKSRFKWCIRRFIKRGNDSDKKFVEDLYEYFLRG